MLLVKRLGPSSGDKRYINAIAIAIAIAMVIVIMPQRYVLDMTPRDVNIFGVIKKTTHF